MNFEEGLTKIQMRAEPPGLSQNVNLFLCCNEKKHTWLFTVEYIYVINREYTRINFLFSPRKLGEMIRFYEHIVQMGLFNQQLGKQKTFHRFT